eukprot:TRINITY_DN44200_c0_g1_i1.p1 TRINITY_DN44200_c0_g1~~TRINITY_DN44200_c0_g1_i1.p1  ORF type:complete len:262 (-),score=41.80 TRINITY_DN44200_c0_g1_i1:61-816(-)
MDLYSLTPGGLMLGVGASGAMLMFIADLVLYYPSRPEHRTAISYFTRIDPGAEIEGLCESTMQGISNQRLMIGGVLGPVAASMYSVGFLQFFFGLQPKQLTNNSDLFLPAVASFSLSSCMIIGGTYHALFAYTGFLSKAVTDKKSDSDQLRQLIDMHRTYLRQVYKWAAFAGLSGNAAFIWCCITRETATCPPWLALLAPAMSAPLKKALKRRALKQQNAGGLVICGGLTNLWNLTFFIAAMVCLPRSEQK